MRPAARLAREAMLKLEKHRSGHMAMPLELRPAAPDDRKLTLSLPAEVVRQLRERMAREETTLRALVLEALRQAGYAVPAGEIRDRRRHARRAA
jgi:hypothetical protein